MIVRRPGPIVRRLLRSPALLYDCNVGWLLGHRFLRLTHTGRQSGRHYQTMLEVLGTGPAPGKVIVIAGLGRSADWYRNVQAPRRPRPPSGGTVSDRCTALLTKTRPVANTPDPGTPVTPGLLKCEPRHAPQRNSLLPPSSWSSRGPGG